MTWAQTIRVFIAKQEYFAFLYVILILAFTLSFNDTKREILVNPSIYDEGWCHWLRCTNCKKHLKKMGYLAWRTYLNSDDYLQIFCRLLWLTLLYSKGCWIQGARFERQHLGELQEAHKHLVRIRMDKDYFMRPHSSHGSSTRRPGSPPARLLWARDPVAAETGHPREPF